ncbi:MAG: Sec-independent protein translocase TatA [Dehalococcoidia bacterium]|nr:Sec-independent protein translocase TatA [Dehalococcoidia bacterium]
MKGIGPLELFLIFGILLLIFGAGRLAGIGKAMGTSIREFKKGMREGDEDDKPVASNVDASKAASSSTKPQQH